jgi:hypothetical protein
MKEDTSILSALEQGNPHTPQELLPLVYDELRRFTVDVSDVVPITVGKTRSWFAR